MYFEWRYILNVWIRLEFVVLTRNFELERVGLFVKFVIQVFV